MTVFGVKKGKTTKGNSYTIIHVVRDFSNSELSSGAIGQCCENIYIGFDVNVHVNDDIEIVYGVGFGGKAVVNDVRIL